MEKLDAILNSATACQKNLLDIDNYLKSQKINLSPIHSRINEGYMSEAQKLQYIDKLNEYKKNFSIKVICEIGLNGGHSAETLINNSPFLEKFVSFDINKHHYTSHAAEYFRNELGSKFEFIEGDSVITVPTYTKNNPSFISDLIYIDGCHLFDWAIQDIVNCKYFAHKDTILWIDDVYPNFTNPIGRAVKACESRGIIKVLNHFSSYHPTHGFRGWVEAQYCK